MTTPEKTLIVVANAAVDGVVEEPRSRKRCGAYRAHDPEMLLKIAKLACDEGVNKAARKLESTLGHTISISTVQSIRHTYKQELKRIPETNAVVKLPPA